jgi:hypothetical protein
MRMRTDVERLPCPQNRRTHPIEENEGPDKPALCRRQGAANLEAANVLGVGDHHQLDLVAGEGIAGLGVTSGEKTHFAS